jgi:uncharacterized protein YuzE
MRLEYSQTADALYIVLVDVERVDRTVEIDNGTMVDLLDDGTVAGIEVLSPARQWPLDEIIERFALEADDVLMLRMLSAPQQRFAYPRADVLAGVG